MSEEEIKIVLNGVQSDDQIKKIEINKHLRVGKLYFYIKEEDLKKN